MNKCIDCEHGPCYTHMTNNNWEALLKRKTEYLMKAPCMIDEADLRSLANSFSELKDQEHKAELEVIKGELQSEEVGYEHDRNSNNGSYGKTVAGVQRDTMRQAISILDSHINKLSN